VNRLLLDVIGRVRRGMLRRNQPDVIPDALFDAAELCIHGSRSPTGGRRACPEWRGDGAGKPTTMDGPPVSLPGGRFASRSIRVRYDDLASITRRTAVHQAEGRTHGGRQHGGQHVVLEVSCGLVAEGGATLDGRGAMSEFV
jgi:hypothetical protein